jgi:hypothetical protein
MDVKTAVVAAKDYVRALYESEQVSDVSLEEVEFDPSAQTWLITIEFSRPAADGLRTRIRDMLEANGGHAQVKRRVQKIVYVSDVDGTVTALKNREAA